MLEELFSAIGAFANVFLEAANELEKQETTSEKSVESATIEEIDTTSVVDDKKKSCITLKYSSDIDNETHMYSYMSEMLDDAVFKARTVWNKVDADVTVTFVFKDREFHFKWNNEKDAFYGDFAGEEREAWYCETDKDFFVKENNTIHSLSQHKEKTSCDSTPCETTKCAETLAEEPIDLELDNTLSCADSVCENKDACKCAKTNKPDFDVLAFYAELNDIAKDNFDEIVPVMIDAIKRLFAEKDFHFYFDDERHDVNKVTFTLEDAAKHLDLANGIDPSTGAVAGSNFYKSLPNSVIVNSIKQAFDFADVELKTDKETNQHIVICTLL